MLKEHLCISVWFSQSEQRKYLHLWDLASLKPRLKSSYKHPWNHNAVSASFHTWLQVSSILTAVHPIWLLKVMIYSEVLQIRTPNGGFFLDVNLCVVSVILCFNTISSVFLLIEVSVVILRPCSTTRGCCLFTSDPAPLTRATGLQPCQSCALVVQP